MKSSKSTMQSEDIFPIFQDATKTAFQFLLADLDFKLDSITVDDLMAWLPLIACRVKYRNETTEIEVMYDWYEDLRGTPQVCLGRLNTNENGSLEVEEGYNLDLLVSERCPDKSLKAYPEDPVDRIKHTLNSYAMAPRRNTRSRSPGAGRRGERRAAASPRRKAAARAKRTPRAVAGRRPRRPGPVRGRW